MHQVVFIYLFLCMLCNHNTVSLIEEQGHEFERKKEGIMEGLEGEDLGRHNYVLIFKM